MKSMTSLCVCFGLMAFPSASPAAETTTFAYDALGRLNTATSAGSVNNGLVASQAYDPAGNRVSDAVTNGQGAPVVVVPLNGFTIIPIDPFLIW